ncbi:MAG: hypothetical protein HDR88_16700 [Bacteroides sp.]|nr:hypothetical protein [Bacteroides sp.]
MKRFPKYLCGMAAATMAASTPASTFVVTLGRSLRGILTAVMLIAVSMQASAILPAKQGSVVEPAADEIRILRSSRQNVEDEFSPLFEVPGTPVLCRAQSLSTYKSFLWVTSTEIEWAAKNVVVDGTDVYIQNILTSAVQPGSYIKGELIDGTVTFNFPQDFYEVKSGNRTTQYFVNRVIKSGRDYILDPECQSVTFEYKDGVLTQKDGVIGVCTSEGTWSGYSEENMILTPYNESILSIPEGLKTESYAFLENGMGHYVEIATDNDTYYIKGLYEGAPDAAVKAILSDGKLVINSPQYIGVVDGYLAFAVPGRIEEENGSIEIKDSLNFTIDTETKSFKPEDELDIILINTGFETVAYITYYVYMQFDPQAVPEKATPVAPEKLTYYNWLEEYDDIPYDMFEFTIMPFSTDNLLLPYDRLFYEVLFDNKVYVFEPDTYLNLDEPISLIPYLFSENLDIFNIGYGEHHVYIYDTTPEYIGVKAYYKNDDGTLSPSETVSMQIRPKTGISDVVSEKEVQYEKWYTLDGKEVAYPVAGVYVKWIKYADGSVKAFKVKIAQ